MRILIILLGLYFSITVTAQNEITSQDILNNSIKFHDPKGKLASGDFTLYLEESRPDGSIRKTQTRFAPAKEIFEIISFREEHEIKYKINKNNVEVLLDGSSEFTEDEAKKLRINKERASMMKNYYLYLWHLPMKLNDPGTLIDQNHKTKVFNSHSCYELKITYDKTVGHDIWYFYFDKQDFQMRGYRFYHDESKNDGEYIYIEGLTAFKDIMIPAKRDWYTHKEDKFLGSDLLVKISK